MNRLHGQLLFQCSLEISDLQQNRNFCHLGGRSSPPMIRITRYALFSIYLFSPLSPNYHISGSKSQILTQQHYHQLIFSNWSGGGVDLVHSALRPLLDLLCPPRVTMMMEKLVERLTGETELLGENLPHRAVLSTANTTCYPDANPGRRGG
jgi:hypothetical protein